MGILSLFKRKKKIVNVYYFDGATALELAALAEGPATWVGKLQLWQRVAALEPATAKGYCEMTCSRSQIIVTQTIEE